MERTDHMLYVRAAWLPTWHETQEMLPFTWQRKSLVSRGRPL